MKGVEVLREVMEQVVKGPQGEGISPSGGLWNIRIISSLSFCKAANDFLILHGVLLSVH